MINLYDENGKLILDKRYQEILKLDKMLSDADIPHTLLRAMDGWVIVYPTDGEGIVMDAIEHLGSYGREADLLEIRGLMTVEEEECDSVVGDLTAENVFNRIIKHWKGI